MSDQHPQPAPDPRSGALGPLSTTPVPLADAEQVRARGRQRARRGQAVLAGTGVVLVTALGGGAALLIDRSPPTALVSPADTVTQTQTLEPSPTKEACADEARCLPVPDDVRSTLFDSPPPGTVGPGSVEPGSVEDLPADTLVTTAALEKALPSSDRTAWTRYASSRTAAPWDFTPCGSVVADPTPAFLSGRYQLQVDGSRPVPEGPDLRVQVSRFENPVQATTMLSVFQSAIDRCPTDTESLTTEGQRTPDQLTYRHEVMSQDPFAVARFSVEPAYPWPLYYGVVAVDGLVAVWTYQAGEVTDRAGALEVAQLVREGLCRTAGTC